MARQEELIRGDDTSGLVDQGSPQTSNKTGKQSSARKPSNSGPDSHSEHVAPVPGAFGNEETRDDDINAGYITDQAPKDKARHRE
jgi:hypothetical protein